LKKSLGGVYRIYNIPFQSDFPLPELSPLTTAANDYPISVHLLNEDQFDSHGFELAFEWANYDGVVVCWCERRADDYLLVFPGNASFLVTMDGEISCLLHAGSDMQMLRHLLLNQVIPRYLATSGHLVLHASAVTLESGHTVAFLGSSGFGKSTLASSFHRHGAQLIDDDTILLELGEQQVTAIGGFPGIRLFPDSVRAVFDEGAGFTHYTPYTDKQQLLLQDDSESSLIEPHKLDALFLLFDPSHEELGDDVLIEPVSGSNAMMAMIQSAFSLDPSDRKTITRNFRNIGQTISECLDVFSLRYPRDHDRLPEVREAVTGWLRGS
jgi:hypothetical protein